MSTDGRPTALVTGASRGIGRGIAVALGQDGFRVAVDYRSDEPAARESARLVTEAGGDALLARADMADSKAARRMVAEVLAGLGHLFAVAAATEARVPLGRLGEPRDIGVWCASWRVTAAAT